MVHVPFRRPWPGDQRADRRHGGPRAGHPPLIKPHVESGKVRVIAVDGQDRHPALPAVPTLQEAGLNVDHHRRLWPQRADRYGPKPILARLRKVMTEMIEDKRWSIACACSAMKRSPDRRRLQDFIVKDLEQWRAVAKAANIKIEN